MEVWQKALETVLKESFIHIADLNAAEEFITFTTNIIRCLHVSNKLLKLYFIHNCSYHYI